MNYYLDTRDLYLEMCELRSKRDDDGTGIGDPVLDEYEQVRLRDLENLFDAIGEDAMHGEMMVPVSEFDDYARELARDLGLVPDPGKVDWPLAYIDWRRAAEVLAEDYTRVTFDGVDYLVRV